MKVTSDYFGQIPPDRLVVRDDVVFLRADGQFRSKIGLNPRRSKAILGSYDADNKVLTIVQFNQPAGVTDYVNALWKLQDNPFGGDAANSYNDGAAHAGRQADGAVLRARVFLAGGRPGSGQEPDLTRIARSTSPGRNPRSTGIAKAALGVSLEEIKTVFKK